MGFMDKAKNAAAQAQEMAQQAQQSAGQQMGGGMPGGVDMQKMQDTQRISQQGLDGTATITAISETGNSDMGGSPEYKIDVEASLGGDPYPASALQNLIPKAVEAYQVGKKFNIKVDPEDKSKILLMGSAD